MAETGNEEQNSFLFALGLRKTGKNILHTLSRQFISIILQFITVSIIARTLGPEGNGQYVIAVLIPAMLVQFLDLGLAPSNVFYISRKMVSPLSVLRYSFKVWIIVTLAGAGIGILVVNYISELLFPGFKADYLIVSGFLFPVILMKNFLVSILQGVQDFKRFNIAEIFRPLSVFSFILVLFLTGKLTVTSALGVVVIGHLISLLFLFCLVIPKLSYGKDSAPAADLQGKGLLKYGFKVHVGNLLSFANNKVALVVVNFFLNPAAAGLYAVSIQISEKIWIISHAVSAVILPRLSELGYDESVRRNLTPLIGRWVLLVTFVAALFVAVTISFLIPVVFGDSYIPSIIPLLLLLPGIIISAFSRIFSNDIASRGIPQYNTYTALLVLITNFVLSVVLIPTYGINGAAISATLAYSADLFMRLVIYTRVSKNSWIQLFSVGQTDRAILQLIVRKLSLGVLWKKCNPGIDIV
ncbi:hypothetical protein CHISP_1110 [Chitinispirillum alkaliphilum]|nr:hypothetical protein CHISP_1110 [Chitinispirillum alkaliphilum]